MVSFCVFNKPHTKRENCHQEIETNHSLEYTIYHFNPMSSSLRRKEIPQYQEIGRITINLNVDLLQLFVVTLVHHYFTLQLFI